jgi:hypothetical protein
MSAAAYRAGQVSFNRRGQGSLSSKLGTSADALGEHGAVPIDGATVVVRLALLPEAVL